MEEYEKCDDIQGSQLYLSWLRKRTITVAGLIQITVLLKQDDCVQNYNHFSITFIEVTEILEIKMITK